MDPKENAKTTEEMAEDIKKPLSDEELDQVSGAGNRVGPVTGIQIDDFKI